MFVRYCPECRDDYRMDVECCADCGAALITCEEDAPRPQQEQVPSSVPRLPEGPLHVVFSARSAAELKPLLASLAAADIAHRLDAGPGTFHLRVQEADRDAARQALAGLLTERPPESLEEGFDSERGGYASCPACEEPLRPENRECPGCGLDLGGPDQACPTCGAEGAAQSCGCSTCGPD